MVSQFNDVQWFPNPDPDQEYPGVFMAVGQFIWELNAMMSPTVKWPTNLTDLKGVAWISLDGLVWTTLPFGPTNNESFWIVYNINYVHPIENLATLTTDLGLYVFKVDDLMRAANTIFGTEGPPYSKAKPCVDFTSAGTINLPILPAGRTGPFSASCSSRDATGQCISCVGSGQPITIPQLIGEGGVIQPDVDVCLVRPFGDGTNPNPDKVQGYSAIEAMIDSYAIAAYAGYDSTNSGQTQKPYVQGLRQSFLMEAENNDNSVFVCPQFVNTSSTPSGVIGPQNDISDQMQCDIDPSMGPQSGTGPTNTWGPAIVRRPSATSASAAAASAAVPDYTYDGTGFQKTYASELRQLTFVPYDSHGAVKNTNISVDSVLVLLV
jgi:hypothetical protein